MSDYKPVSFKAWTDDEPQNVTYPAGENVTYPVMPERVITQAEYDQACRERDEWKTRAAELENSQAMASKVLESRLIKITELERVNVMLSGANFKLAESEAKWQAHAARFAETLHWIRSQLPPDDTYAFLSRLEGRVIVTLAATPADSLARLEMDMQNAGAQALAKLLLNDDGSGELSPGPCADALAYLRALEDTLESFVQEPEAMQEIMRQHNLKIDNLDDPMQKLAFTFYSKIVAIAEHARAAVEAAKAKGGER